MRSITAPSRPALPGRLAPLALLLTLLAFPPVGARADTDTPGSQPPAGDLTRFELLGEAVVPSTPPATDRLGAPVGGLSALLHDTATGTYLAVSDDGAERGPARVYTLEIDLDPGTEPGSSGPHLATDGARVIGVTELLDAGGRSFEPKTVDPEGLALLSEGHPGEALYVASEGKVNRGVPPFVRRYDRAGHLVEELPLPAHLLPGEGVGVRHNLALESLTVAPGGGFLFTASENALVQDGPEATVGSGSASRLLRWRLAADGSATGPPTEWIYPTDPVAEPPQEPEALQVAGVVELLAVGPETLLSLERSFTEGVGTTVRLFRVSLAGATEVTGHARLADATEPGTEPPRPVSKTLLLDLAEVLEAAGVPVDNLEGLTFGPDLPDGRRTLLLVSDDNFNDHQRTQIVAFAVSDRAVSAAAVQGRGHRSPLEGEWVREVRGVVTALDPDDRTRLFVQDPEGDGEEATSDALAVRLRGPRRPREAGDAPAVGELVALAGRVEERGIPGALTVTTLTGAHVRPLGEAPLPEPVVLGAAGRRLPSTTIDDDGLSEYDPVDTPAGTADAIDLWESLEGMRVAVPEPVVVGATTRYGGFVVVPDGGAGSALRSPAGGMVVRPEDFNPERILVDTALLGEAPELWVGDRLSAPLVGVVGYGFSNFQLLATAPIPRAVPGDRAVLRRPRPAPAGALTLATYNVLNLHPGVGEQIDRVAASIVDHLGSPDLVALQEIQDASGPADDGVVAGAPTFEALIRAIAAAGGPAYAYRQIDPVDGTEGGQPGGNIRVGFLFREDRLELPPALDDAPAPGPTTAVEVRMVDGAPRLAPNPGRVEPEHPCFSGSSTAGRDDYEPTRRSLAIELRFGSRTLFVIDNHWRSKRGDGRLYGAVQPPVLGTEEQRTCQGRVVADFVRTLLAADPDAWVIVAGDLNEHEFRPPVAELEAAGLTDLVWRIPQAERYTYNFEGNSQVLDHVLVSPAVLRESVPLPSIVHVNTDRPAAEAASDHDPIRVILVPGSPPGLEPPAGRNPGQVGPFDAQELRPRSPGREPQENSRVDTSARK